MTKYIYLVEVTLKLKGEIKWLLLKHSGTCLDFE